MQKCKCNFSYKILAIWILCTLLFLFKKPDVRGADVGISQPILPFTPQTDEGHDRHGSQSDDIHGSSGDDILLPPSYIVKPGDTLWAIAQAKYGKGTKYSAIFEANRSILKHPDRIYP